MTQCRHPETMTPGLLAEVAWRWRVGAGSWRACFCSPTPLLQPEGLDLLPGHQNPMILGINGLIGEEEWLPLPC